ncbi:hypothetical protein CSC81_02980 [Tenacibaculum discolor]|uniref:CARDB domain-containing protein n=1 Tax=Tenacibaculum discolor TaxID=361581 RepID=A0A2G1BWN4_9FLAO|nr:CARDB domain-containing protein [Tenacibaculum discolor]MDP2540508.1 CARDB domain-containing protein [Tenacibaculum discolor]PHN98471.1 hypothetical protein CSC81_02980 [Tenacibaculum discolor]PHO00899.1 hypothetical protein CSC82_26390 [Rhodobacteraceae bacterium 4F10]
MEKRVYLFVLFIYFLKPNILFSQSSPSYGIIKESVKFIKAPNSLQKHGTPYKFYIEFESFRPSGTPYRPYNFLYYGMSIYEKNDIGYDFRGSAPSGFYNKVIGFSVKEAEKRGSLDVYTERSGLIDLSDINFNNKFPTGEYKLTVFIMLSNHIPAIQINSEGDPYAGLTNGVKRFTINDICTDCNNGIFIDTDSDGDGVYDNEDECRYEAGSKSNNGCPKPDFKFEEVFITSACGDCKPRLKDLGSKRHIVYRYGLELNINEMLVLNSGGKSTKPTEIKYYYSLNNSLGVSDIPFAISTSVSTINSNTIRKVSQIIDGNDFKTEGMPYGNVYIIGKIDPDNKIEEVDESNNTFVIPITFKESPTSSKISSVNYNLKESSIEKPYKLDVYDINGNYKKSFLIENKSNENNIIKEAGLRGIHILKTTRTTKKVLLK